LPPTGTFAEPGYTVTTLCVADVELEELPDELELDELFPPLLHPASKMLSKHSPSQPMPR
jgi:hypothetical protein